MKIIEPIAVIDCYADGLGAVQIMKGGNARFVMYVDQINEHGVVEHIVVAKVVMPVCSVPEAIAMAWAATSGAVVRTVQGFLPHPSH